MSFGDDNGTGPDIFLSGRSRKDDPIFIENRGPDYGGGDGSSVAAAVRILGVDCSVEGVLLEYDYIEQHVGRQDMDWILRTQKLLMMDGKTYDVLTIETVAGEQHQFYFDITDFYGRDE